MNWYRVTVTFDEVPDEPNVHVRDEPWTIAYLDRLGVVLEEGQLVSDGGTWRLDPPPKGQVLRWALTEAPDTSGPKYRS